MEFLLQWVDEIEDVLNHARFRVMDFGIEIGLLGCALFAALAIGSIVAFGAPALVLSSALGMLGAAVLLKARRNFVPVVEA